MQDQNRRPLQHSRQEIINDQTKMVLVEIRSKGLDLRDKVWWTGSKPAARHLYLLVVTPLCNPLHLRADVTR